AALAGVQQAIRLAPRNPDYPLALGRYLQKYGQQEAAIEVLEKAAKLYPDFAEIPYSIGVSHFSLDDYPKALKSLDSALSLNPRLDRAFFLRGMIETAENHFDRAEID